MWKHPFDLAQINALNANTLGEALGIEFTEMGDDFIIAKMPVDSRTVQPHRMLHGGASVALAETLGSVASTLCIEDLSKKMAVGVEINANHLRPATKGFVFGKVTPIRVGRSMHVWNIEITDELGKLVCVSRLTVAVVDKV
ncbi:MAG: hotdog fold thioesterase [Saprospiraceae bacterium]|nr:hotdog fold thioesterase [Saprospiraceae bacterium]